MISDNPESQADVAASNELLVEAMTESDAPPAEPEASEQKRGCPWFLIIVLLVGVLAAAMYFCPAIRPEFLRPVQTEVEGLDSQPEIQSETVPLSPAEEVLATKDKKPTVTENRLVPMADIEKSQELARQPAAASTLETQTNEAPKPEEPMKIFGFTVPKIGVPQFVKDLGSKVPVPNVVKATYDSAKSKFGATNTIGGMVGGVGLLGALAYYYAGAKLLVVGGLGAAALYGWKNGWLSKIPGLSSIPTLNKFAGTSVAGPSSLQDGPQLRNAQF